METSFKQKALIGLVALCLGAAYSPAQGIDPEKKRDINRLMELTGGKELATLGLPAMIQPIADQIKKVVPKERADEFVQVFTRKASEAMLERVTEDFTIPAFDKYFSHEEIKELIQFWGSDVVQRFIQTQLRLAREMQSSPEFRNLTKSGPKVVAAVLREMQADFPELEEFLALMEDQIEKPGEGEGAELLNGASYINRTANLRLTVPEGWTLSPEIKASSQAAGAVISPDQSMFVIVQREPYAGTLADYKQALEDDPDEEMANQEKVSESEITVDGKPGLRLVFRGKNEGVDIRQIVTLVIRDGALTVITAATFESRYAEAQPVLDGIADSYRRLTIISEPGSNPVADLSLDAPPIRVSGNVQSSKLIYKVDPVYPEEAKKSRIEGTVLLQVTLDEEGNVVKIDRLNGEPLLAKAAVEAVRQWAYSPTLLEGDAVPVVAKVTVDFVLK